VAYSLFLSGREVIYLLKNVPFSPSGGKQPSFRVDTFHTGEVYQLAGFESQVMAGCEGGWLAAYNSRGSHIFLRYEW
jgi:hypothetical protein